MAFVVMLKPDVSVSCTFLGIDFAQILGVWNALIATISIVLCLVYAGTIGLDRFGLFIAAICGLTLASTMLNNGDLYSWAALMLPCAATALSASALCLRRRSEFLWAMFAASAFYLFANLVFAIIEMIYDGCLSFDYLFYGYRNSTFMVALPALASSLALDSLAGRRITVRTIVIGLVSLLELYIGYSATSFCAFVAVALLVLVVQRTDSYRFVNGLTVAVVYVALFVGLVVLRFQNIGEFFIQGVLGRSTTFSGRTYIWDQALTDIANGAHWLFGYGIDHSLIVSMPDGQHAFYAHNDLLQFMIVGGLLLAIVWLAFLGGCAASAI